MEGGAVSFFTDVGGDGTEEITSVAALFARLDQESLVKINALFQVGEPLFSLLFEIRYRAQLPLFCIE